jgi:hypothetical protein
MLGSLSSFGWRVALFLALPALTACNRSAGDVTSQGDDAGDGAAGSEGGVEAAPSDDGGGGTGDAGFLGDGSTTSNCAQGADLLYVVSEELTLYTFDPKKVLFSPLGSVDCANHVGANSMAVDRDAVAWINYQDGSLWKVDTKKTPTVCQASGYTPGQQGVQLFGMGFTAKSAGSNDETLFVCDLAGGGLFFLDLSAMSLNRLGPFQGAIANRACELTGTGDARLFGLFAGSPLGDAGAAAVDQIDAAKQSAMQTYSLPTLDTGTDWAVSFWGGDFYLYTADKYDMTAPDTTVTRFRPSDGSLAVVAQDIGFRVVGAGSGTCAPTAQTQ